MDDNFASIVVAVIWGRSVLENIRKFLVFQLTINLVAGLLTCGMAVVVAASPESGAGGADGSKPAFPLSAVQLLWINLIMDSFAALMLATEPPDAELMAMPPQDRSRPLLTRTMLKAVAAHAAVQLALLLFLTLADAGAQVFGLDASQRGGRQHYTNSESPERRHEPAAPGRRGAKSTPRLRPARSAPPHPPRFALPFPSPSLPLRPRAAVFNTFVLLQLFNLLNARRIHDQRGSLLRGFGRSRLGLGVLATIVVLQVRPRRRRCRRCGRCGRCGTAVFPPPAPPAHPVAPLSPPLHSPAPPGRARFLRRRRVPDVAARRARVGDRHRARRDRAPRRRGGAAAALALRRRPGAAE